MNILESLNVVIVGILVVFLGLVILIFCIKLSSLFFKDKAKNSAKNTDIIDNNITKDTQVVTDTDSLDDQLVAVITSAIYASMIDSEKKPFIVKRIKRISNC